MVSGKQPLKGSNAPDLHPPGSVPEANAKDNGNYRWVWLVLAAMVLLSLMVAFVLPQLISRSEAPVTQTETNEQLAVASPSNADTAADRETARQTLQAYLRLRAKLELVNAGTWGEPDWSQSAHAASVGDRYFGERNFNDAAQSYNRALQGLEALEKSRDKRLAGALDSGQRALQNNDVETAQQQYELALNIEPGHALAQKQLARARVRDDVIQRTDAATSAEANGDLEAARIAYAEAVQMDGEFQAANTGLQRVSQQLADIGFRDAISRTLTALDAGRLNAAAKALDEAAAFKPGDSVIRDTRQRLAQARRQSRLAALRRQAEVKISAEDWQAVVNLYQKALQIVPDAGFARDGLAHAQDRVLLHRQIDHYLDDPERIQSPEPLANAERLLSVAGEVPAGESRLAEKIARLKQQVSQARTPVPVRLQSDGQTDVVIFHVGRLGQFRDHKLALRPGTYTVVGSRPGYRDVRKVLTVHPGAPPPPLQIRCEEKV